MHDYLNDRFDIFRPKRICFLWDGWKQHYSWFRNTSNQLQQSKRKKPCSKYYIQKQWEDIYLSYVYATDLIQGPFTKLRNSDAQFCRICWSFDPIPI